MFSASHLSEIDQKSIPGYFHWRTDTVASNFLVCPKSCKHNITFRRNFAGNNVVTCCVENAQPFWIISKSKNLLGVLHLKPAGEYGFVTEATGADDIEPNTFNYRPGSLLSIDLDGNFLKSIELSNLFLDYWFNRIIVIENRISKLTNELSSKFNFSNGEGIISLARNHISEMPNLSKIGLTIDILLSAVFKYPINLNENPIRCDCKFGSFIETIKFAAKNVKGVHHFICKDPPLLREKRIIDISEDLLTCAISMKNGCPPECNCYEHPSRSRIVVNCSSTRKYKMPSVCPQQDDLDINFNHNLISVFEYRTFLNRTFSINLSNNRIASVDPFVYGIMKLRNINLQHNKIVQIHKNVVNDK
ncbi:SLIT1 [Mytilus edulis]|uniref:SLIT1 n=1 Tax=Mytilus edulis TaxID=6550 RepID=A0A8S3PXJ3_MYTED|nr:SLIT1 [Mytilus edulis]